MNNTGKIWPLRSLKSHRGETYTKGDTSKYIIRGCEMVCKEQGAGSRVARSDMILRRGAGREPGLKSDCSDLRESPGESAWRVPSR